MGREDTKARRRRRGKNHRDAEGTEKDGEKDAEKDAEMASQRPPSRATSHVPFSVLSVFSVVNRRLPPVSERVARG